MIHYDAARYGICFVIDPVHVRRRLAVIRRIEAVLFILLLRYRLMGGWLSPPDRFQLPSIGRLWAHEASQCISKEMTEA